MRIAGRIVGGAIQCWSTASGRVEWTVAVEPATMQPLPPPWQEYFGVRYSTVAGHDEPWFKTVRGDGLAAVLACACTGSSENGISASSCR